MTKDIEEMDVSNPIKNEQTYLGNRFVYKYVPNKSSLKSTKFFKYSDLKMTSQLGIQMKVMEHTLAFFSKHDVRAFRNIRNFDKGRNRR